MTKQRLLLFRRVLHKLRSRGEEVGQASRGKSATVLRPVEKLSECAFATFIDPVGERVVFLFVPLRGGTYVYEVLVSDALGVLQARRLEGRRRDARRFERELRGQDRSFEVPAPAARVLIARAAKSGSGALAPGVDRALVAELLKGVDPEARPPGRLAACGSATSVPSGSRSHTGVFKHLGS